MRRAWPHGAGCSSCRCGAETASDGQSRDATRRAWLHFHVMKALVMRDLVVAHRCPGPPSAPVADPRLLSPRTSLGKWYGDGMGCEWKTLPHLQRGPLTLRRSLRCQIQKKSVAPRAFVKGCSLILPVAVSPYRPPLEIPAAQEMPLPKARPHPKCWGLWSSCLRCIMFFCSAVSCKGLRRSRGFGSGC